MSIAPPSDIVLDVAQAADPAQRQSAVARLAAAAAGGGVAPGGFEGSLAAAQPSLGVKVDGSLTTSPLVGTRGSQVVAATASPYQKFEAVMMQTFVEAMLPKDPDLYGDAASADACRSMFAQKISEELAKSGRLGVAKAIERYEARATAAATPPPPVGSLKAAGG